MQYTIVGSSAAGLAAARTIVRLDSCANVVIISAEEEPWYPRIALSHYLSGEIPLDSLLQAEFSHCRIALKKGTRVVDINASQNEVILEDGSTLTYDKLLLATGSEPVIPRIPGIESERVCSFWTLHDALALASKAETLGTVAVIGGGYVGVQAAVALRHLGLNVSLIEQLPEILSAQLDHRASDLVTNVLRNSDIQVMTDVKVKEIDVDLKTPKLVTSDGDLHCDMVVAATGVRPNLTLAHRAGVAINEGIIVDEYMHTSEEDIFAAGDVVEYYDIPRQEACLNPLWTSAVMQGNCAGLNMAGQEKAYAGDIACNVLEVFGLKVASVGMSKPIENPRYQTTWARGVGPYLYKQLVLEGDVIRGAVLVGDIRDAGVLHEMIRKEVSLSKAQKTVMLRDRI